MDLLPLKTLQEVAAPRLFVTRSAVSQRVHRFEDQLARLLFDREKSGVVLTAEGRYGMVDWGREFKCAHEEALPLLAEAGLVLGIGTSAAQYLHGRRFVARLPVSDAHQGVAEQRVFSGQGCAQVHASKLGHPARGHGASVTRCCRKDSVCGGSAGQTRCRGSPLAGGAESETGSSQQVLESRLSLGKNPEAAFRTWFHE